MAPLIFDPLHHPDLPDIDLNGAVWVDPRNQEDGFLTEEEVNRLVDNKLRSPEELYVKGHPQYTYQRVFFDEREKLIEG